MSGLAVEIENLSFRYRGQSSPFIDRLSLQIEDTARFGLFGPNGAGKTTLMNLMTGLLSYHQGHIRLLGQEVGRHQKKTNTVFGFVPQDFSFYQELTPLENLQFFGAWAGLNNRAIHQRSAELLHILGLEEVRNKPVGKFSGGMKRRINLAIGVIHRPRILFLDEPTVGVDVQSGHAIIHYLKQLNREGTTLIYSSHQLNEAEELCKKIALIDAGRIIVHDDLEHLLLEHRQEGLEGLFLNLTGKAFRD